MNTGCPCGSGLELSACCGPRHDGTKPAETPEALMRSRYAAFALAKGDYLRATSRVPMGDDLEAESVLWLGLTVVRSQGDTVEFIARSLEDGAVRVMHEVSSFERENGRWLYVSGTPDVKREKVERNAPCPCGSGRKFKQCHQ